jgi:hypothetical protein
MYGPPPCRKRKMKIALGSAQMYPVFVESWTPDLDGNALRSSPN